MTPEDLIDTLDTDARDAKELAEVARRIVAERDAARAEHYKAIALVKAKDEYINAIRSALGATSDGAIYAAERVVAERDEAQAERGAAHSTIIAKDEYIGRFRGALGAMPEESAINAANRVVAERDEARAERDEARAERDAAKAELRAARPEPRKPKVGDRIRILEYYEQGRRVRKYEVEAEIIDLYPIGFTVSIPEHGWLHINSVFSRWEFVDAPDAPGQAEPRKPKVGDRIRILEYYDQGGTLRRHDLEGLATVRRVSSCTELEGHLDSGSYFVLNKYDRWEFVA